MCLHMERPRKRPREVSSASLLQRPVCPASRTLPDSHLTTPARLALEEMPMSPKPLAFKNDLPCLQPAICPLNFSYKHPHGEGICSFMFISPMPVFLQPPRGAPTRGPARRDKQLVPGPGWDSRWKCRGGGHRFLTRGALKARWARDRASAQAARPK